MKNIGLKKVGGIFVFLAVFAGASAIVMLLWNALIPSIIGWSAITYCESAGLIILSRLLFGGFGHLGHGFGHHKCHGHHHKHMAHIHEKLNGMSRDERREYIRNRMGGFGGGFPCGGFEKKEE